MKRLLGALLCSVFLFSCKDDSKTAATGEATTTPTTATLAFPDVEIGDPALIPLAKKGLEDLASGDIDTWMTAFADNAIYRWNNLDSLVGKAAIADYWKKRRTDAIDSMSFTNMIWLPIKVHKSQAPGHLTGDYVLSWKTVYVKYKNGKSMTQRMHTAFHYNADKKLDRVSQYLDRAPINAAMAN